MPEVWLFPHVECTSWEQNSGRDGSELLPTDHQHAFTFMVGSEAIQSMFAPQQSLRRAKAVGFSMQRLKRPGAGNVGSRREH